VSEIAGVYEKLCPGATVHVTGAGSVAGINDLANQTDESKRSAEAVMYDGTVDRDAYPTLNGTPIAAISFVVVVNQKIGVHNITVAQLRDIFGGSYTYWDQVNPRLPHLRIDIVARDSQSGTRQTFEATVLGGKAQQLRTSQNCTDPDSGQASSVILCEMNGTAPLLQKISTTDGVIGYAELPESNSYPNVTRIQINGHDSDIRQGGQLAYPFWTTEHIYTYRTPTRGSLLSAFLSYLRSDKAENIMQNYGGIPCAGLNPDRQQELCRGRP
jgi:ABC-type phosphate transport system substrate-binding protein